MKPNHGTTEGPGRLTAVQGAKHPPELQALLLAAEGAGPDVQERIVRAYYAGMEGAPNSVAVYQSILMGAVYNAIRHDVGVAAAALPDRVRQAAAEQAEMIRKELQAQGDRSRAEQQAALDKCLAAAEGKLAEARRQGEALAAEKAKGWQAKAINYGAIAIASLLLGGWLVYFFDAKRVSDVEARSEDRVKALMASLPYATRLEVLLERHGGRMESQAGRLVIHPGKDVIKNAYRDLATGDAVVVYQ